MVKNFPSPSATPIIGQPVTIVRWVLPVTVEFMCNCQVPEGVTRTSLQMMASQPTMCRTGTAEELNGRYQLG